MKEALGCLKGHQGPYCRLCIANYFKSVGEACVGCVTGATSWALVFVVVLAFALIIFLGYKLYQKASKRFRRRAKALGKIMWVVVYSSVHANFPKFIDAWAAFIPMHFSILVARFVFFQILMSLPEVSLTCSTCIDLGIYLRTHEPCPPPLSP